MEEHRTSRRSGRKCCGDEPGGASIKQVFLFIQKDAGLNSPHEWRLFHKPSSSHSNLIPKEYIPSGMNDH